MMVADAPSVMGSRIRGRAPHGRTWCAVWIVTTLLGAALGSEPPEAQAPTDPKPSRDERRPVRQFAPGVHIDWQARAIEVDAKVAFRAGPLELLACSPQTREHESVLVVDARPMHIFQAMGLIGLEPGHPVRYVAETESTEAPTGQPVALSVRFGQGDSARVRPARELMRLVGEKRPPDELRWVFAGSRTFSNGRFGADADGTVACVVDFDTALIALDTLHSADNDKLWLEANTPAIPPIGTPCRLVIRASVTDKAVVVVVDQGGRLLLDGRVVSAKALAERVKGADAAGRSDRLVISAASGVRDETIAGAREALINHGLDADRIETRRHDPNPKAVP